MRWLLPLLFSGCLSAWNVSGPWACGAQDACADGYVCDDGLCCIPGGTPMCPTLPTNGQCGSGATPKTWYRDRDGDGAGNPSTGRPFCSAPVKESWVLTAEDCNDDDATIGPRASERCNALDDDCDGVIDDGTRTTRWYRDDDLDGYGVDCDAGCVVEACAQPMGFVPRAGDCAPTEAARFPGAPERCNDVDDNCNDLPDDPPFIDVENPGDDGGLQFNCATSEPGRCSAGGQQCLFDVTQRKFVKTCVARARPTVERCGNNIDDDCDGFIDNPPGCGGPPSLISARGATFRAVRVDVGATTVSGLPPRCLASEPGAREMGWLNPSWVGSSAANTQSRHVWAVEAPSGQEWDLSVGTTSLAVDLELAFFINAHPSAWGGAGWFANPVVTLCGLRAGEYVRFVPSGAGFIGTFASMLHPWSPEAAWRTENGPVSLDRRRVRSLELAVSPVPPDAGVVTFTLVVRADAGFQ